MRCKSLDNRLRAELKSLNTGLLRLLVHHWEAPEHLGLGHPIAAQLRALPPAELDYIAGTPVLLAGFEVPPTGEAGVAADAETAAQVYAVRAEEPLARATSLFAAALLTWLWKMEHTDRLVTALCIGTQYPLPRLGVPEIEQLAAEASARLRVRFRDHPRFWPDLLRAARSNNREWRELSRLTVLPLLLAERQKG